MNSKAQRIANRFKICDKKPFVFVPSVHLVERFANGNENSPTHKADVNKILILLRELINIKDFWGNLFVTLEHHFHINTL